MGQNNSAHVEGGRVEGLACTDQRARPTIDMSRNFSVLVLFGPPEKLTRLTQLRFVGPPTPSQSSILAATWTLCFHWLGQVYKHLCVC